MSSRLPSPRHFATIVLACTLVTSLSAVAQTISTIAGNGSQQSSGDGGQATAAAVGLPSATTTDAFGNVFVVSGYRIRRIGPDGVIQTIAGTGVAGTDVDGKPATETAIQPIAIALDAEGRLYFAEPLKVRRISATGLVETVAGNGIYGFSGDGGPASGASFAYLRGLDVAQDGSIYLADSFNARIRRIGVDGIIETVAGNGRDEDPVDHVPATATSLGNPRAVATAADGSVYIADPFHARIRRIAPDGVITTVAGGGAFPDDPVATSIALHSPIGVAIAPDGSLRVLDGARLLQVTQEGQSIPVAGRRWANGYAGDGGPAIDALFRSPEGVAVDAQARAIVADTENSRVRRITEMPAPPPLLGAHAFLPVEGWTSGATLADVAIADLDGDGRDDLVVTTRSNALGVYENRVYVWAQGPDGDLGSPAVSDYMDASDRSSSGRILLTDLDGDGFRDIVVARNGGLTLFRGNHMRRLQPRRIEIPAGGSAVALGLMDVDRDGRTDIVAATFAGVEVFRNDGIGGLSWFSRAATPGFEAQSMSLGDIDADGESEVVVSGNASGTTELRIFRRGDGALVPSRTLTANPLVHRFGNVRVFDVDGDGRQDVVGVPSGSPLDQLVWFRQTSDGLAEPALREVAEEPQMLASGDIDMDGREDLVVLHRASLGLLPRRQDGSLAREVRFVLGTDMYNAQLGLALGDLDGSGCPDVVVTQGQRLAIFRSAGCHAGPDVTADLSLTPRLVEAQIANAGDIDATDVVARFVISVRGVLQIGSLPPQCGRETVSLSTIRVSCTLGLLRAGQRADITFPLILPPTGGMRINADLRTTTTSSERETANNNAWRQAVTVQPDAPVRAPVRATPEQPSIRRVR